MKKNLSEKEVLNKLDISDFRHMTKDKIISFASMFNEIDPDVAIEAIKQFPDFANMSLNALKDYRQYLEDVLEANDNSSKECFAIYNKVIDSLQDELKRPDISVDERKNVIEQMMELTRMADQKDSENKSHHMKLAGAMFAAVIAVAGLAISALGGKADIKLPNLKA